MKKETQEKLEAAKRMALDAAAWSKAKTLALWKSGPKGKAICIGCVAAFLLVVFMPGGGKKEVAKTDSSALSAKQRVEAQAEMQRMQVESQEKAAVENDEMLAEMEEKAMAEAEAEALVQIQVLQEAMKQQQAAAQAEAEARRVEMEQRQAAEEARRKQIADERAARLKAEQEAVQARKQAIEDAKNHIPTDTGKLEASALSDKSFSQVFIGASSDDEGTIYAHGRDESIRVFQSTSRGLLVGYAQGTSQVAAQVESFMGSLGASFDRVVWVDTKTRLNEDNSPLRPGFYVRKGMHSYIGTDGGEHTLAQYVEISDEKTVTMLKNELRRREQEKKIAAAEAQELAEEHGSIEVDVPIKSLLGFKLGVPPSQVKPLLRNDDGTAVRILNHRTLLGGGHTNYRLATPFRLFTRAEVYFSDRGNGKHLERVHFRGDDFNSAKYTQQSYEAEVENAVRLIEKKFGITFQRDADSSGRYYTWSCEKGGGEVEHINVRLWNNQLSMDFGSYLVRKLEEKQFEANKKSIQFGADEGADQL